MNEVNSILALIGSNFRQVDENESVLVAIFPNGDGLNVLKKRYNSKEEMIEEVQKLLNESRKDDENVI